MMSRVALIVEDDPSLQRAMAKELERARFHVLTAFDFDAAVTHLGEPKVDVACIDLGLPSESGYELCEHIRNRLKLAWLPILVTSERSFRGHGARRRSGSQRVPEEAFHDGSAPQVYRRPPRRASDEPAERVSPAHAVSRAPVGGRGKKINPEGVGPVLGNGWCILGVGEKPLDPRLKGDTACAAGFIVRGPSSRSRPA